MNPIYELAKRMITTGNYQREDLQNKLNIYFFVNQITQEQYLELTKMINPMVLPVGKIEVGGMHEDNTNK